jgi:16S rRNA processing protein RimM
MDHVIIGEIIKVHGVRGEVLVHSLSDVPGRFRELDIAMVIEPDGSSAMFAVDRVREGGQGVVVKLHGIDDREMAQERLIGRFLAVERTAVPPHGSGENYHFELVGLEVVRTDGGRVGVLESIIETGANDVYVVRGPQGGEILIPATREVVMQVDVRAGRMTIRSLPGLLDGDESEDAADDARSDEATPQ